VAPLAGADPSITAYSGYAYCPKVDALLLFGGGHAATPEDVVLRFPMDRMRWSADYVATPKASRVAENLTPGKFWKVPGQVPPIRPISRHTYTGFLWSSAIERMLLMPANNGIGYGEIRETVGGNMAEYDPVKRTWEDIGVPGAPWHYLTAEDPVSGHVLAVTALGLRVYDPRARRWLSAEPTGGRIPYLLGGNNVVYFPPNDTFYCFGTNADATPNGPPTLAFKYDRQRAQAEFGSPKIEPLETNWRPRASRNGAGTGFAYDAANKLIVGQMVDGKMYAFRPLSANRGEWLEHPVPMEHETSSYCHAYVPRLNAHFVTTDVKGKGRTTFAFRWDPAKAQVVKDTRQPPATIQAGGRTVSSMQAACDFGGVVALSAGGLYGGRACAVIKRPVEINGKETLLNAPGIGDKGILIVRANTVITSVEISGARVPSGNGAAIRHEAGNLTLRRVKLHDSQDGVLTGTTPAEVLIEDCELYSCGSGTGQTHALYIGRVTKLVCTRSRFRDTRIGHHLKSRAATTIVRDCELGTDFEGTESYNLDFENGGDVTVENCVLRQGPKTDNSVMVNFGNDVKGSWPQSALRFQGCRFESTAGGIAIRNSLLRVVVDIRDCDFKGVAIVVRGPHTMRNCRLNGKALPDVLKPSE